MGEMAARRPGLGSLWDKCVLRLKHELRVLRDGDGHDFLNSKSVLKELLRSEYEQGALDASFRQQYVIMADVKICSLCQEAAVVPPPLPKNTPLFVCGHPAVQPVVRVPSDHDAGAPTRRPKAHVVFLPKIRGVQPPLTRVGTGCDT